MGVTCPCVPREAVAGPFIQPQQLGLTGIHWFTAHRVTLCLRGPGWTWDPPCRSRIQDPGWDQEPQTQPVPLQRVLRGRCLSGAELGAFPPPPRSRCPAPRCRSSRAATLPTSQFSSALSRRKCPSWNQRVQRKGSQTDGGQGKDGRLPPAPLLRLPLPCPKRCPLPGPQGGKAEGLVAPWAGWVLGWGPGGLVPAASVAAPPWHSRAVSVLPAQAPSPDPPPGSSWCSPGITSSSSVPQHQQRHPGKTRAVKHVHSSLLPISPLVTSKHLMSSN